MENFIVSARKYRPATFDSVVGQESITQTLKNAIRSNHLAHAYLFCGPRGVGKTTCARIFAKTLNCSNLTEEMEACNKCEACLAFNEARSYNIHELDAASNNSVEDIRSLIEQVRIPPQVGEYSIYIIDEVHMLSAQAFNAFLKTLEEPPHHAIFILATTEKHKIIPTILSRCQIFDFNRIQTDDIVNYLEKISKEEALVYERDAFNIIAQKADGGMRDALSIFDQIISFSGESVTYKNVIDNLNVLDYEYYFSMTEQFLKGDISNVMLTFNEILNQGFDARNFLSGLGSHFRNLLVSRDQVTLTLMDVGENIKQRYLTQTAECGQDFLLNGLELLNQTDNQYNTSQNKRLHIEILLIQLCRLNEKKKEQTVINPATKPAAKESQKDTAGPKQASASGQKTTPEEKKTPEPVKDNTSNHQATTNKTNKKNMPGFSIKEALDTSNKTANSSNEQSDNQDAGQETDEKEIPQQNFTQEALSETWDKYAASLDKTKERLYNTLKANAPALNDTFEISFEVNNPLQIDQLNIIKPELLDFLQKELNNKKIKLHFNLVEENKENQAKKLYTPEDKYKHMTNKNPKLDDLRQQFNLDFE